MFEGGVAISKRYMFVGMDYAKYSPVECLYKEMNAQEEGIVSFNASPTVVCGK